MKTENISMCYDYNMCHVFIYGCETVEQEKAIETGVFKWRMIMPACRVVNVWLQH